MAATRQIGVDAVLERGQTRLLEAGDLAWENRPYAKSANAGPRHRPSAPRKVSAAVAGSLAASPPPLASQTLELVGVELIAGYRESIPATMSAHHLFTERLEEARSTPAGSWQRLLADPAPRVRRSGAPPKRPRLDAATGSPTPRAAWRRPTTRTRRPRSPPTVQAAKFQRLPLGRRRDCTTAGREVLGARARSDGRPVSSSSSRAPRATPTFVRARTPNSPNPISATRPANPSAIGPQSGSRPLAVLCVVLA